MPSLEGKAARAASPECSSRSRCWARSRPSFGSRACRVVRFEMADEDRVPSLARVPFEVFQALPKADLHVHLDGSLRLETILDLAAKGGIRLPAQDIEGLRDVIGCGRHCGSLVDYLKGFSITLQVMQTEAALERIAFELAE